MRENKPLPAPFAIAYSSPLEAEIAQLEEAVAGLPGPYAQMPARWLAIQLLEGEESLLHVLDQDARRRVAEAPKKPPANASTPFTGRTSTWRLPMSATASCTAWWSRC